MKITLTILDVLILMVGVFFIIEWRIHDYKKRIANAITDSIHFNNQNIENLLNRKDEVLASIVDRIVNEIFDGNAALRSELLDKIKELEDRQNSSKSV